MAHALMLLSKERVKDDDWTRMLTSGYLIFC